MSAVPRRGGKHFPAMGNGLAQYWLLSILVSSFQKDFSTETETYI